ncbi:MAG TPA: ABC transporter ATP-binding protein [Actinomycetota bacterium]|nr:ABC transporter ATP-binding protein [Actinomycetota bacterium]
MIHGPLRRLLRVFFSEPRLVGISFAGATTVLIAAVFIPLLIRTIVDRAVARSRPEVLLPLVGVLLLAYLIKVVGIMVRKVFAAKAGIATESKLRSHLYDHVHNLDVSYHEMTPVGQLMSRASSDLQHVGNTLGAIPFFTATFTLLLVVSAILISIDPLLGIVVVGGLPFMALLATRFTRRLDPVVRDTQAQLGELTSVVEETVTGIRVVKAFGREQHQVDKLADHAQKVASKALEAVRLRAALLPMFEFLPAMMLAAITWLGGNRVIQGDISPGTFVLFALYATQLVMPVRAIGWFASDIQQATSSARRIFEVLDTEPGVRDRPDATALLPTSGHLRFENVSFVKEGRRMVDDVSIDIPSGTSLALVGPTGCGKSTLIRLVLRFIEPTEGKITIDGSDIGVSTLHSVRSQVGTVFEDTFLFSDSVRSNIAFGKPDATEDEVVRAALLAQAHDFIVDLPDGYQTLVGEQGYSLSGGQRQRIAIARAILMDPSILLLDDATSAIDPEIELQIRIGLAEAMKQRTTLIVARRPASAALADRVAFMQAGRIVATGTHEELWAASESYRATLGGSGVFLTMGNI